MRNSVSLILIFFIVTSVLSVCAALVLYLYMNTLGLTLGGGVDFLPIPYFLYSLTRVFPYCTIITLVYLFLFLVRRSSHIPLSVVFWLILAVFTWIVCIPLAFEFKTRFHSIPGNTAEGFPSGQYFRESENSLYYWFPAKGIPETVIKISPGSSETSGKSIFLQKPDRERLSSLEGRDTIIYAYAKPPAFLEKIVTIARSLMDRFEQAWHKGWKSYLISVSFCLAIAALWPFGWITPWRLLNITFLGVSFLIVSLLNYELTRSVILIRISEALFRRNSGMAAFFPVFFNGFIFLFMNLVGGLTAFLRALKTKKIRGKQR